MEWWFPAGEFIIFPFSVKTQFYFLGLNPTAVILVTLYQLYWTEYTVHDIRLMTGFVVVRISGFFGWTPIVRVWL